MGESTKAIELHLEDPIGAVEGLESAAPPDGA
jgi:hypothetical protein